jgi:flagellar hook-associated protein 3 FlgL
MRISTFAFHTSALNGMLNQQSALSVTQGQVATGKRIQTPADDPIGAVHILELERAKAESQQFGRNADAATARLTNEEQALGDAALVIRRIRELVLQANNSTIDETGRAAIAAEIRSRAQDFMDVTNRRDGNGEYLFSGYATTTQPFSRTATDVAYAGDQGSRLIQVGPTQRIADSHSGFTAFMDVLEGNGVFATSSAATNAGTGSIDTGTVVNRSLWVRDNYTLTFGTPPDTWQITDSAATVVATGAYTADSAINFNGVQITVSGTPAAGDTFTVAASQREDIFTTIDNIIVALEGAGDTNPERAQLTTSMGAALQQLDQDEKHLLNVRTQVGARLSTLTDIQTAREGFQLQLDGSLSELQDVDYAEALSRMNRQLLGLEAAQRSYATISQMSLFNYL